MYQMYPEWGPARHRTDERSTDRADHEPHPARRRPRYWEKQLVGAGAPVEPDSDRPDDN